MDTLTRDDLQGLIGNHQDPCVSIYMQAHRAGPEEIQKDPIRLKNLLRLAEDRLVERGLRRPEARELLAPVQGLLNGGVFWEHGGDGLAIFRSPDVFQTYRLPIRFEELVMANDRFHVRPLLPLLSHEGHFYLLALAQNQVRLFKGSRFHMEEVQVPDLPRSMDEMRQQDDDSGRQMRAHSSGGTSFGGRQPLSGSPHGHGEGYEDTKTKLLLFFHEIDHALQPILANERAPLILAAVEYYFPLFEDANTYQHLMEAGLHGSPEGLSVKELHARAWELVEPNFQKEQKEAVDLYERLAGKEHNRASSNIKEIVPAAFYGRVGQVFIPVGEELWGNFDPDTGEVRVDDPATHQSQDLFDFVATQTLLNGGEVYAVDPSRIPQAARVAAVFRY